MTSRALNGLLKLQSVNKRPTVLLGRVNGQWTRTAEKFLAAAGLDGDSGRQLGRFQVLEPLNNGEKGSAAVLGYELPRGVSGDDWRVANHVSDVLRVLRGSRFAQKEVAVDTFGCDDVAVLSEALHLSVYQYPAHRAANNANLHDSIYEKDVRLTCVNASENGAFQRGAMLAHAENLAKYLAEKPANQLTPKHFVSLAQQLLATFVESGRVRVRVLDDKELAEMGAGGILSVARGSREPCRMLVIESLLDESGQAPLTLVGKGVTFDAGGISIKPGKNMHEMKADMTGAASTLAAMYGYLTSIAVGKGKQRRVNCVIPLAENLPDGDAYKPGDVITMLSGKTVEIDNTDAEGRLLLADAITYAQQLDATAEIVSVATLTGAIHVALGDKYFAAFTTASDAEYAQMAEVAAKQCDSPMWRMPLDKRYAKQLKSNVADIVHCSRTAGGGACTAAWFLKEFVDKSVAQFTHLDIAGTMSFGASAGWRTKGMSGIPTRFLAKYVESSSGGKQDTNNSINSRGKK